MIKGLNNRLANVPTITGLSNVVADSVITDDLVINGIDVGTAIADLQQLTTGITYNSISDTTTVDNNVIMTKTLNVTNTVTAPTFDGMATYMQIYNAANSFFYSPTFVVSNTGPQLMYRSTPITGITPVGINPSNGELRANILSAVNSAGGSVVIRAFKSQSITVGVGSQPLPLANATSGDFNVGIGYCLQSITEGSNNFAMGYNCALNLKRSSNNCLMGHRAGLVLNFSNTTTAYSNVCVGDTALTNADEIQHCCAVGAETGLSVLNGNVFCTMIGNRANVSNGLVYATAIGGFATCTTSNTVQLGRTADNVNCPNTISVASTATVGNLISANTQIQGEASLAAIFRNTTGGVQRSMRIIPNSLNGEYNWIHQDGDALLYAHGASANAQALALSIWSSVTSGIRISPTALTMGWGGSSSTPTHMLTFDVSGAYFNTVPKTTVIPSNGDDLCNKTYVDSVAVASPSTITATTYAGTTLQYPVFVEQTGSQQVRIDYGLNFNASTNTLSCTQFNGLLAGTATQANVAAQVTLFNNATGSANYLIMSDSNIGTSTLRTDPSGAAYDSTTNTASISVTGNAGSVTITGTDVNNTYYPVFVSGSGSQPLNIDPTTTPLTYNPNTGVMSVRSLATMGAITGRTGSDSVSLTAPSANTADLIIRHNNAAITSNILIHTTGAAGGSVILRTNGAAGKGLTITSDGATTFDYPEIFLNVFTGATSLGLFGFGATPVDGTNTVSGYNACRSTFTANGNNTLYGSNIGTSMFVATKNNTVVGFNSGAALTSGGSNTLVGSNVGALITTGIENTAMGQGALSSNIGGSDNVCIGFNAGSTITGSSNICIGSGATVPVAGNSNQIVLGGLSDTIFMQGGLRFYMPPSQLTATATLPRVGEVLPFFYAVNITLAAQTITLPSPVDYNGHMITFKRKANNVQYTMAHLGGGTRFTPIASITNVATITVTTAIFQQTMISDGSAWCVISQA